MLSELQILSLNNHRLTGEISGSQNIKMAVFWNVVQCSLVDTDQYFKEASIHCPDRGSSAALKCWLIHTKLHGSKSSNTTIFINK